MTVPAIRYQSQYLRVAQGPLSALETVNASLTAAYQQGVFTVTDPPTNAMPELEPGAHVVDLGRMGLMMAGSAPDTVLLRQDWGHHNHLHGQGCCWQYGQLQPDHGGSGRGGKI